MVAVGACGATVSVLIIRREDTMECNSEVRRILFGAGIGVMCVMVPVYTEAAVIAVPQDEPTIASAIMAAAEDDTIQVSEGIYTEVVDLQFVSAEFPASLTIRGGGMFETIWNCGGGGGCLNVRNDESLSWVLEDIGFSAGSVGGALRVAVGFYGEAGGQCALRRCRFFDMSENVLASTVNLEVVECIFSTNAGLYTAIEIYGATLDVSFCSVDGGFCPVILGRYGGSIRVSNTIFDSVFCDIQAIMSDGVTLNPDAHSTCNCVYNVSYVDFMHESSIESDPQFCGVYGSRDWSLQVDSPCLDDPTCGRIGARGVGCGVVESRKESWGGLRSRYR